MQMSLPSILGLDGGLVSGVLVEGRGWATVRGIWWGDIVGWAWMSIFGLVN